MPKTKCCYHFRSNGYKLWMVRFWRWKLFARNVKILTGMFNYQKCLQYSYQVDNIWKNLPFCIPYWTHKMLWKNGLEIGLFFVPFWTYHLTECFFRENVKVHGYIWYWINLKIFNSEYNINKCQASHIHII